QFLDRAGEEAFSGVVRELHPYGKALGDDGWAVDCRHQYVGFPYVHLRLLAGGHQFFARHQHGPRTEAEQLWPHWYVGVEAEDIADSERPRGDRAFGRSRTSDENGS